MKISPGPVNNTPKIGRKNPIATQIKYSCTIAEIKKELSRETVFGRRSNSTCDLKNYENENTENDEMKETNKIVKLYHVCVQITMDPIMDHAIPFAIEHRKRSTVPPIAVKVAICESCQFCSNILH